MNNNTPELPDFMRKQYEFAAHIRNPETNSKPEDVEDRRMAIYRDLFYNNVEGFISDGFPVLRELYNDTDWHAMVRDFFANHHCKTPYFLEISQEFLSYLENERDVSSDPAFINELAHYEWVELALSVDEKEIPTDGIDTNGDLLNKNPVISPLAWLLNYQYDVQHIGPDYIPDHPPEQTTTLVVYRDKQDEIGFLEINPMTAHLIQSLQLDATLNGKTLLKNIAQQLNHPDPDVVISGGLEIMIQLREADILLGTRI
ncbi:MAG: DUF2063 domain-containing protein [Gammaproteobacteria bacterium]|nr:DUF2063 domain-containing protein [Gammaproteobacteria bacterium]